MSIRSRHRFAFSSLSVLANSVCNKSLEILSFITCSSIKFLFVLRWLYSGNIVECLWLKVVSPYSWGGLCLKKPRGRRTRKSYHTMILLFSRPCHASLTLKVVRSGTLYPVFHDNWNDVFQLLYGCLLDKKALCRHTVGINDHLLTDRCWEK